MRGKINNMTDFKVFNMETVGADKQPTSVQASINTQARTEDVLLLQRMSDYWNSQSDFRDRRKRNRMYHRGDQLKDPIQDSEGNWTTEEAFIKNQGKQPLVQNQIRQLMKNIVGQFLMDTNKAAVISRTREDATIGEMLTNTLQYVMDSNQTRRIDTRMFEEFMLSGAAMQKITYKYIPKLSREDVFISNRSISQMFTNSNIRDPRLTDMDVIGEFYDISLDALLAVFAKNDEDISNIKAMYSGRVDRKTAIVSSGENFTPDILDNLDFYIAAEPHLCRVYEVWQKLIEPRLLCHDWLKGTRFIITMDKKEEIDNMNLGRVTEAAMQGFPAEEVPLITYKEKVEEFWYVKFLTPYGEILFETETVYNHKEHPYTLLLHPLIDGEVWGFVEDVLDQQRYINRLVQLMDFIIGASAKGVLLVPEEAIPDDMDIDDIAEEWSKFNGVIKLKLKHGATIPKQISSAASIPGVNDLLALQQNFMKEISGINSAIQGQQASSGTPAKLYAMETANASLNTKDYFETFNAFLQERNWKVMKTIVQFYDSERNIALAGSNYTEESLVYSPERAQNAQIDLIMSRSADSPAYRSIIEDSLMQFVAGGLIPLELYLKNSSLPFADSLLSDITNQKQQMMEAGSMMPGAEGGMGAVGQELQAQGGDAAQANPETMAALQKYMG